MLKSFFFSFYFFRFAQSGFYLDFFLKKISELFVRNIFIYSAQFFGEKFLIEELTRKIFEKNLWRLNKYISLTKLFYSLFFIQLITLINSFMIIIFFLF